jgi:hypothetical protein
MKLYDTQATATTVPVKGKYIYFGASIIYCDEKNSCIVYYPTDNNVLSADGIKKYEYLMTELGTRNLSESISLS